MNNTNRSVVLLHQSENFFQKNKLNFIVIIALINYFCIHFFVLPGSFACAAFYDNGWMSVFSMLVISSISVIITALLCSANNRREVLTFAAMLIVNQVYAFREADLHTVFTEQYKVSSVTNLKFYTQADVPLIAKIIPLVILLLFFISALYLIISYGLKIIKALFKKNPSAVAFVIWAVTLFISQILDRSHYFYKSPNWRIRSLEEMLEVSASVFALCAMIQFYKIIKLSNKQRTLTNEQESKQIN
jgi:hypothetical protein